MLVKAEPRRCLGTGNCVLAAPEVFDQDNDDGTVTVLSPQPPDRLHAAVRRAVRQCPSGAISLAGIEE